LKDIEIAPNPSFLKMNEAVFSVKDRRIELIKNSVDTLYIM